MKILKSQKFWEYYSKSFSLVLSIFIGFFIAFIIYYFSFYIHEFGHILYGFFDNIFLHGQIPVIKITNWIDYPFLNLRVPQQTKVIEGVISGGFVFGGMVFVLLVSSVISWILYKAYKKKTYLAFPFVFLFYEFFGNFLCGTDNLQHAHSSICSYAILDYWVWVFYILFLIPIVILLYPKILRIVKDKLGRKSYKLYLIFIS